MVEPSMFAIAEVESGARLAEFRDVRGFFVGDGSAYSDIGPFDTGEFESIVFQLSGLAPNSPLIGRLSQKRRKSVEIENLLIQILDLRNMPIGEYIVFGAEILVDFGRESAADSVTVTGLVNQLPHADAEGVWVSWRQRMPEKCGEWMQLPIGKREAWLEVSGMHHSVTDASKTRRYTSRDIKLNGAHISNPASFLCSMGEAINGPGGYFGRTLASFEDCLHGGFGIKNPFTLEWVEFGLAQESLGKLAMLSSPTRSYLDVVLEIFEDSKVSVVKH